LCGHKYRPKAKAKDKSSFSPDGLPESPNAQFFLAAMLPGAYKKAAPKQERRHMIEIGMRL
jgi:hypothetical protein